MIRPIEAADNPEIARIIRAALTEFGAAKPGTVYFDPTTDHLFELFREPGSAYFVAVDESNMLLGGAGIYPTPGLPAGCCELVKIYLSPEARGKRLGATLIAKSIETAIGLEYRQIYLETLPELNNAVKLYEQFGFEYLDGPLGASGHFGCNLWMLKNLT